MVHASYRPVNFVIIFSISRAFSGRSTGARKKLVELGEISITAIRPKTQRNQFVSVKQQLNFAGDA
jgi:hypothetical protein